MRDETRIEASHRPVTSVLHQPIQVARLGAAEAARQQALLRLARPRDGVRPDRGPGEGHPA
jgi:hypothetical protein